MIVPTPGKETGNPDNSVSRVYIYASSKNKVLTGRIMEFWGKRYNVADNLTQLITDYYNSRPTQGFTGGIYEYSLDYKYINGSIFKDGEKLNARSTVFHAKGNQLSTQTTMSKSKLKVNTVIDGVNYVPDPMMPPLGTVPANCTVYYETDEYYSQGNGGEMRLTDVVEVYIGTKCTVEAGNSSGASGNGSSSGDSNDDPANNPDFGCYTGELFANNSPNKLSYDIRPRVNLCLGKLLQKIKAYAQIWDKINSTFGCPPESNSMLVQNIIYDIATTPDHRLTFDEQNLGKDNHDNLINAESRGSTITMNEDYLNTATNLSVARTIIHEIVHLYFDWTWQKSDFDPTTTLAQEFRTEHKILYEPGTNVHDNDVQHAQIAAKYVDGIAQMLYEYANGEGIVSPVNDRTLYEYCHDLAWGGLMDTDAWDNLSSGDKDRIKRELLNEQDPSAITNHSDHATPKSDCH
jgi:hypothetical protein